MLRSLGRFRAAAASAAALGVAGYSASSSTNCISKPDGLTKQRTADYTLAAHYHGKRSVRVLRVRRQESGLETVQEYNVQTRLFSPEYSKTFTHEDNSGLVATDTQKNTVYVVAQRTDATTPEYAVGGPEYLEYAGGADGGAADGEGLGLLDLGLQPGLQPLQPGPQAAGLQPAALGRALPPRAVRAASSSAASSTLMELPQLVGSPSA